MTPSCCGKKRYATRGAAERTLGWITCGWWHLTSRPARPKETV